VATIGLIIAGFVFHLGVSIYRQQAVISEFDRLNVHYSTRPYGPKWLHNSLRLFDFDPDQFFQEVVYLNIGYDVDPSAFDPHWFASLPALEELHLHASWFGSLDCKFLASLTKLRELSLRGMPISDDALRYVCRLRNLESLDLSGTQVTDSALAHFGSLKQLKFLWLCNTRVTDNGIEKLQSSLPDASISRECPST
jgi:hypothetical protein